MTYGVKLAMSTSIYFALGGYCERQMIGVLVAPVRRLASADWFVAPPPHPPNGAFLVGPKKSTTKAKSHDTTYRKQYMRELQNRIVR